LTDERVFIPRAWEEGEEEEKSKTDAGGHGVRDRASTERGANRTRIALAKNMACRSAIRSDKMSRVESRE
jgi:hypothetical protein